MRFLMLLISMYFCPISSVAQQIDETIELYLQAIQFMRSDFTTKKHLSDFSGGRDSIRCVIGGGEYLGLREFTNIILNTQKGIDCFECGGCYSELENKKKYQKRRDNISDSLRILENRLSNNRDFVFESSEDADTFFSQLPQEKQYINTLIGFSYPTKNILTAGLFYYRGKKQNLIGA